MITSREKQIAKLKLELKKLLKNGEAIYIEKGTPVQGSKLK